MSANRVAMHGLLAAIAVALSANALRAQVAVVPKTHPQIYVDIVGMKQGQFKGDGVARGSKKATDIDAVSLAFEVESPRDVATGMASGKRRYRPITFVHELDAASVQLESALASNEVLKTVDITVQRLEKKVYTIRLENASVASLRQFTNEDGRQMEEVALTFQKISASYPDAGVQFADDWRAP